MQRETLDAMWQAISENKKPFTDYLFRKADLMGKDKLGWEDIKLGSQSVIANQNLILLTKGQLLS